MIGHGGYTVRYDVAHPGHPFPSHSVTVLIPEQSQPSASVLTRIQAGVTHSGPAVWHAGGLVVVIVAQARGVVVGQFVAIATSVGI